MMPQRLANQKSRGKRRKPLVSAALKRYLLPLTPVCALLFVPLVLPPVLAQESTNAKGYLSVNRAKSAPARNAKRSDADAGVQLLETIINRVMNIPQVALTKSNTQIAQNLKQQNSPTDFKLAIRPKESGKAFAAGPKLPLVIAQAPAQSTPFPMSSPTPPSLQSAPSAGGGGAGGQGEMKGEAINEEGTTESWRGGALSRVAMKQSASNSNSGGEKTGLWENSRSSQLASADAEMANRGLLMNHTANAYSRARPTNEEARKVPDLATAVNRLYKTSKGLEDVQTMADSFSAQQNVAFDKAKARFNSPREFQTIDDRPVIKDMREITTVSSSGNSGGVSLAAADRGNLDASLAPSAMSARRQKVEKPASYTANKKSGSNGAYSNYNQAAAAAEPKLRDRRDRLALLPPSVATGIPGLNLNLGASEAQAMQALSHSGGKLKMQKIRDWIVYSWIRKEGESGDALQLFFRHGLLDAIRIFDPELISSGFGVSPGDQLEVVKERFGEPAFLLPEPNGESAHNDTTGKNYIYPISQVGFQLARSPGESSPQVVSVLIFAVK